MKQRKWVKKYIKKANKTVKSNYNLWAIICRIKGKYNPKIYSRKRMYQAKNRLLILKLCKLKKDNALIVRLIKNKH